MKTTDTRDFSGPPWRPRIARGVAQGFMYGLNPLTLPPLLLGLALAHLGAPAPEIVWAIGMGTAFFLLIPLAYVGWMVRTRRAASLELRDGRRRTVPLLVGIGAATAALAVLPFGLAVGTRLIAALIGCHVVNEVLLLLITRRWKISLHAAGLATFIAMLLFIAHTAWPELAGRDAGTLLLRPAPLYGLFVLVPLLMWARVHTGAHTKAQVLGGTLFGLALPTAELVLLLRVGLLP